MQTHTPKTAKVLGFFLILILFKSLFASENTKLQFLDLWDFSPLSGVEVVINDQHLISDKEGNVSFNTETSDPLNLFVTLNGYYSQQIQVSSQKSHYLIYLQPLQESTKIHITADRPNNMQIDLPGSNTIIRASSQRINNSETMAQLLDNSTGVFVKNYGAAGALKTISIRGFGAEHTAMTYDGININNQQLGLTELSLLSLQNVNTIEVYRGGNSSLFGSGAVAGAINFVPSKPVEKFRYAFTNSYGSWNTLNNNLMLNFSFGGLNHRFNVSRQSSDNDFLFSFKDKTYARKNSDQKYLQLGYSFFHHPSSILAEIIFSDNKRGVAKQVLDQVKEDDFARQKDKSIFTRLKWNPFSNADIQLYWIQQENLYNDLGLVINNQELQSEHTNTVFGLLLSKGLILFDAIRSFTKFEIEKSDIKSTDAGKHERWRSALSAILERSFYKMNNFDFKFSGSMRWENYSESGVILLPKLGLTVSNRYFNFYSSYGYNYRIPTFNELHWQPGGNPDLQSEKSNSFETGVSYAGDFFGKFYLTLDYYRNEIKNMIRWVPDNQSSLWRPVNISAVKSEGVELGLSYTLFSDYLYLTGNYSYSNTIKTKAEFAGDNSINNQVPFIPREMTNLGLNFNANHWYLNIDWNRTGFRYLTFTNSADEFLPSHNVIGLETGYDFMMYNQTCNMSLRVNNVLNKEYRVMYGYPMPGRNFTLSFTFQN